MGYYDYCQRPNVPTTSSTLRTLGNVLGSRALAACSQSVRMWRTCGSKILAAIV